MERGRSPRALLWIIPLVLCLLPVIGIVALGALLSLSDWDLGLDAPHSTSPDCVHDERPLLRAARDGDLRQVESLIESGTYLDQVDSNGNAALYCAAFRGHPDVVRALADAGAEVDRGNLSGETALHWASRHGDVTVVNTILESGGDPNVATGRGHTPLLWATYDGRKEIVQILLDAGADPNVRSQVQVFEVLDAMPTPTNPPGFTGPDTIPAMPGCTSLTDSPVEVTPLDVAVAAERTELTRVLLRAGAEPDSSVYGCTPLHVAAFVCNRDLVTMLLGAGASGDVGEAGLVTPAQLADRSGCHEVADLLRSEPAPIAESEAPR